MTTLISFLRKDMGRVYVGAQGETAHGSSLNWSLMNTNTTGKQDIILGVIVFLAGFLALGFATSSLSLLTAVVSWIAGIYMIIRGVRKNRA